MDPRDGVWASLIIHDPHPLENPGTFIVNVGKYSIHMDCLGWKFGRFICLFETICDLFEDGENP